MAFYDDPQFILSHIRNSFITSDDTGMCELVIIDDETPFKSEHKALPRSAWHGDSSGSSGESNAFVHPQSLDIMSDMGFEGHRQRSNTAQRLDKLRIAKQNKALIKRIQWREQPDTLTEEELALIFPKKEVDSNQNAEKFESLLSEQISNLPAEPINPFNEYAKFDASNCPMNSAVKAINIFLTMQKGSERDYPYPVVVYASAKVEELIGLICWHYTNDKREPRLKNGVDYYDLRFVEDDGEVDPDFPCLERDNLMSKFGFHYLALVEHGSPTTTTRHLSSSLRGEQSSSISKTKRVVRDNKINENSKDDWPGHEMVTMEALCYQSYLVNSLNRVRAKTSVHLGISGEKIEIAPVQPKGSAKMIWSRSPKPASYDFDMVASCDIIEIKHTGKSVFRLTYSSPNHDYKHHDFESESSVINEIVQKINNILELKTSSVRRDYLAYKERKAQQRKSFSLGNK
ncbi:Target of rapamycin complex 2 subunit mapkap1 [Chamberlinius hualienensis]